MTMELGNLAFGHAQGGDAAIPRHEGWEEALLNLVMAYTHTTRDTVDIYAEDYENDTFWITPYNWVPECECGFEQWEKTWSQTHPNHQPQCFFHLLETFEKNYCDTHKGLLIVPDQELLAWAHQHGWAASTTDGIYDYCNCGYDAQYAKDYEAHCGNQPPHSLLCPVGKPNFYFKPTGFAIEWYKYPFRDAYMTPAISLAQFQEIIQRCITSLA